MASERVTDAPIPEEELAQRLIRNTKGWMQERIAHLESLIESGDNPDGALIYRSDHDKIVARLEAEKQEAHTPETDARPETPAVARSSFSASRVTEGVILSCYIDGYQHQGFFIPTNQWNKAQAGERH